MCKFCIFLACTGGAQSSINFVGPHCPVLMNAPQLNAAKIKHHRRHYACTFGGSRPWFSHSPQCDIEGFPKRFSVLGKTWDLVCVPSPLSTGKAILFIFISQPNCAIFFFLVILLTDELSQYILFQPSPL